MEQSPSLSCYLILSEGKRQAARRNFFIFPSGAPPPPQSPLPDRPAAPGLRGDPKELRGGFRSAAGYLRRELSRALSLRHTPELQFILDHSIDKGSRVLQLMEELEEKYHAGE